MKRPRDEDKKQNIQTPVQAKTAAVKKNEGSDVIDSIFSSKKKPKSAEASKQSKITTATNKKRGAEPKSERRSDRSVLQAAFSKPGSKEWVDDGLGGRFNAEGFTGRVEDGVKIFKAHVLNRPKAGFSKDCPFDCDCCFI